MHIIRSTMTQRTRKRSLTLDGHRTSISLEEPFWHALHDIAQEKALSVTKIVSQIDRDRTGSGSDLGLSSAIRIYILKHYRKKSL